MDDSNSHDNDLMLCKQEDGEYIESSLNVTPPPSSSNFQDSLIMQLAESGTVGAAAAAAILSSKSNSRHNYQFETNPAVRKRQQTRLLRKLKELSDEFAARCGQQICIIWCTPTKSSTKQPVFKVIGTDPLDKVVKNQRESILFELDLALQQSTQEKERSQAAAAPTSANSSEEVNINAAAHKPDLFDLPELSIDGIPTSLDKMTQCHLRMFIPLLLKYSTGRQKPGWNRIECKPVWWPNQLPWANIRVDPRDEEAKRNHPWTEVLKQVIRNCYKYHDREDMLHKFNNMETPNVAKQQQQQQKAKKSTPCSPVAPTSPSELKSTTPPMQQQQQQQQSANSQANAYTLLQQVHNLDGTLTMIPLNTISLSSATIVEFVQNSSNGQYLNNSKKSNESMSHLHMNAPTPGAPSSSNNGLSGSPILLHTDSADVLNASSNHHHQHHHHTLQHQDHLLTHANNPANLLEFNINEFHMNPLWTQHHSHHHQQQHLSQAVSHVQTNPSILLSNSNSHHYAMLADEVVNSVDDDEDEQSKDNIIELASMSKKLKREFNDATNNTSTNNGHNSNIANTNSLNNNSNSSTNNMINSNDFNDLQFIKHKRYRHCNSSMMKSMDSMNNNDPNGKK